MSVLSYKLANCKNCYKCLRECPVKAISIINEQAIIQDDQCILCGKCTNVCPQNAKFVKDSITNVRNLLKTNKVIVSLAPSFASSFNVNSPSVMREALKRLGFYDCYETAIGAQYVNKKYIELVNSGKYPVFITSCCPTVNNLIERHYPNAIKFLANLDSPMVVHAKMLKEDYPDCKVVFVGPCISKKQEANESGIISEALTFQELKIMLDGANIDLSKIDVDESLKRTDTRYYPIERGIIKSIGEYNPKYDYLTVSGLDKCIDVLKNIDDLDGLFIEMNACEYGCVNGPCAIKNEGGAIKAVEHIRKFTKTCGEGLLDISKYNIDCYKEFTNKKVELKVPSEDKLRTILQSFGKYTLKDELNCGACGYATCKAKAIAIYNNMAEVGMCIPYMKEKAESLSNEIIKHSPNGIIMFDKDNLIIECNDRLKEILDLEYNPVNRYLEDVRELQIISEALISNNLFNYKCHIDRSNKEVMVSTVKLEKDESYFSIINDITEDEINRKKIEELKQSTLDLTNDVIEKQMRAVQEIASLLGEVTSDTKIAIYNLRKVMLEGDK